MIGTQSYFDGGLHGGRLRWHTNGALEEASTYVHGRINGPALYYFDDGSPKKIVTYHDGDLIGSMTTWSEPGLLSEQATFVNGKYDGERLLYNGAGRLPAARHKRWTLPSVEASMGAHWGASTWTFEGGGAVGLVLGRATATAGEDNESFSGPRLGLQLRSALDSGVFTATTSTWRASMQMRTVAVRAGYSGRRSG